MNSQKRKLRGKKQSMQIPRPPPTPAQAQKIRDYREIRKRGAKDSIDATTLEENISVNKPRISGLCKPAMAGKNKGIAEELEQIEEKRRERKFDVVKVIAQLPDRPVEWLEIVKMKPVEPYSTPSLETETYNCRPYKVGIWL